jgi:RHS repeat-associated protein
VTRDYDPLGRLVAETDPLGRTTTLAYDAAGRVIERVDGSGRRMRWTYDASGRVHTYGAAGQPPITIERDTLGRPVRIDEPGAQSNRLRWDPAGRLVERARGELALTWRYDEDGRRAALGYPDGTETAYSYDPGGLLSALHHPALGRIDLQRDPAGRLVGAVGDRMRAHWGYTAGELTEYEIDAGGRHRSAQLKQDERGRVIGAHIDGAAQRFTYDPGGQLISATTPDGTLSFSYDANGRLTHETTPAGDATYEYDSAGQLRSVQRPGTTPTRFTYDGAGRRIRELAEHGTRTYAWDPLGRLSAIQTSPAAAPERAPTTVTVDALGELAEVDAAPLLWDTADPWTPLSWIAGTAVVGHGAPWALAGTRAASWLAPDWHGTVGLDRDPWGATPPDTAPAAPLQLGYRGELELDGLTWLRNRIYQPATRAFLAPDPLPAVPGTPWSGNPNHYAGNNPISLADPLGLRPVTDAELAHYRDQMANPLQKAGHWVHDNWQFIAAGAVLVGGIALMATGVGGPIGGAMVAGVLLSGAFSAGFQKVTTGHVDWRKAALDGAIGGLAAGAGAGAGAVIARAPMLADASVPVQAAVRQGAEGLVTGAGDHVLRGEDPITWSTLASAGIGAGAGATGGWLGTRAYVPRHGDWSPAHAGVAGRHAWTPAHAGIPGRHAWTPREETNREKIAKYPSAVGGMTAEKVLDTEPEEHVILPGPFPVLQ